MAKAVCVFPSVVIITVCRRRADDRPQTATAVIVTDTAVLRANWNTCMYVQRKNAAENFSLNVPAKQHTKNP